MALKPIEISVVVPAFNEEEQLRRSLPRIREALDAHPDLAYELIVCDNASTDSTAEVARSFGCTVVREAIRQISRARNRGAGVSAGEWILFIDADSWPSPELIGDLRELLTDSTCVGGGSTVRVVDGPRWFRFIWESKNWSMRTFRWCPGAFILCRREAFLAVDGFSTEHYIFEDYDFVARLKSFGAKRRQQFIVVHKHPFSTSGRKGDFTTISHWLKFAVRIVASPRKSVRDRGVADKWYNVDR